MIKIFVINLKSSKDRRDRVSSRLNELNINFEFFEAVDGRETPHPLFEKYDDKRRIPHRRKPLSGGELGCYASHYLLWEKCVQINEPIIIMEDDAKISDNLAEALETSSKLLNKLNYLRLAGNSLKKCPYYSACPIGSFELTAHERGPAGTLCYAITPNAAKKFIELSQTWYLAVDDFIDRYWHHGEFCFSLMPFPVEPFGGQSTIPRINKDKRLSSILTREAFRRLEIFRRSKASKALRKASNQLKISVSDIYV